MEQIKTKRLIMTLADINDLSTLEEIDKECDIYFKFDPQCEGNHDCPLEECLTIGDIPPGVDKESFEKENYYFYCIWKDGIMIGFITYYLEYQQKDTVYLSVLYIMESHRKSGIGAEILEVLTLKWIAANFRVIRLHCSLRNAMALRFWVKNGFDHIIDVGCDGNLFPEKFGGVELMKIIALDE